MDKRQWKRRRPAKRAGDILRAALYGLACIALVVGVAACSTSNGEAEIEEFDWNFRSNDSVGLDGVEIERRLSEEGFTFVRYQFRGVGFPEPGSYELRTRNVGGREFIVSKVWFEKGTLMFEDPRTDEPGPFEIETGMMRGGEGLSIAVYEPDFDEDDEVIIRAKTDLVPHPIEAEGEGGCRLVVRVRPKSQYGIYISGFGQGEALVLELVVSEWSRRWPIDDFGDGGTGLLVVDPRDSGYLGGAAQFYADGENCSVAVRFPFGETMLPR